MTKPDTIQHQTYDNHGNPLCTQCRNPIFHGDKYIEIRQRNHAPDARLRTHLTCFRLLILPG